MPDADLNPCRRPEECLRQFDRFVADNVLTAGKNINKNAKQFSPDREYAPTDLSQSDSTTESGSPPLKKPRAKESSKYFGVRFRPDLSKWVAEIRVFEWKSVDKKVWLGTFDTEVGAACAVDAARKLLKCQKKRPANFPCPALTAYSEYIPPHLQLTNITEEKMFKEVTVFVKRKAQEYAAGFGTSKGTTMAVELREQLVAPLQYQIPVGDGNGCFQLTSEVESRPLLAVPEDDVFIPGSSYGSFGSYGTNASFGSYGSTPLASCDGVMSHHHWGSPTLTNPSTVTYCSSGPSSCSSSEGTSPVDRSWVHVQPSMWTEEALQGWSQEVSIGDYCLVTPDPSWDLDLDPGGMSVAPMGTDEQTTIEVGDMDMEYLFNMEEDLQESCGVNVGDQAIDPYMNIFHGDEVSTSMHGTTERIH